MRPYFVLLAVLSLVLRWADAPCGCAEHNGWIASTSEPPCHDEHDHDSHDGLAFSHDCGGTGPASLAGSVRAQPTGTVTPVPAVTIASAPAAARVFASAGRSLPGMPLSRAALNVYRI